MRRPRLALFGALTVSTGLTAAAAWSCKTSNVQSVSLEEGFERPKTEAVVEIEEPGETGGAGIFRATFAAGAVPDGETMQIVWDIASRDTPQAVDCNQLRFKTDVKIGPVKGGTGFEFKVADKKLFDLALQADPAGFRKLALESLERFNGPLRGEFCVKSAAVRLAVASAPLSGDGAAGLALGETDQYNDITDYGKECAEEIGFMPPFSCLDGQLLPIRVNGAELSEADYLAQKPQTCDNPIHLGLGNEGQCVPFARLLRLKNYKDAALTVENPDVDTVVICRRYKFMAKDLPVFNDVAVVQHKRSTGATCWYQMLAQTSGKKTERVPPPWETALPADAPQGAQAASTFWMKPKETNGFPCINCHDSDPFMNSPYVMKVKGWGTTPAASSLYAQHYVPVPDNKPMLPTNVKGKYYQAGKNSPFATKTIWRETYSVENENDTTCTDCHRIGSNVTCSRWAKVAAGAAVAGANAKAQTFPLSHWMPASPNGRFTDNTHGADTKEDWDTDFKAGLQAILDCCQNPNADGCTREKINVRPY